MLSLQGLPNSGLPLLLSVGDLLLLHCHLLGPLHHLHLYPLLLHLLKLIGQVSLCSLSVELDVTSGLLQLLVPLHLGHLDLSQVLNRHLLGFALSDPSIPLDLHFPNLSVFLDLS